ncbi:TonB-dependent receptor [bacterium]|nr:TonB-dependent receptor [bacterium]
MIKLTRSALIACLLLTLVLPEGLFADTMNARALGEVQGWVTQADGTPIAGAAVHLVGTSFGGQTDLSGSFLLARILAGSWTVEVTHLGYERNVLANVRIRAEQSTNLGSIQLQPAVHSLDPATWTVRRSHLQQDDILEPSSSVDLASIRLVQPASSAEVLREQPGIQIQKTSHGGGHAIVRGMTSNRVLLLTDGIRMNNSTYRLGNHPYLTMIDPNGLESIDLVRGPGSVLHGSDALGGAVNMITRSATFADSGVTAGFELLGRVATADDERTRHVTFSVASRVASLFLSTGLSQFGDLRRGENGETVIDPVPPVRQTPTGFDATHLVANLRVRLTPLLELHLGHQRTNRPEVPRYDKYLNGGDFRWLYTPQRRELTYLRFRLTTGGTWLKAIEATASLHHQAEGRSTQDTPEDLRTNEFDEVHTLGFSLVSDWQWRKHQVVAGFDSYQDAVQSSRILIDLAGLRSVDNRGRFPDDARYTSNGLFVQDRYELQDHLVLLGGMRYSQFSTHFDTPGVGMVFEDVHLSFQAFTLSGGVRYDVSGPLALSSSLSQGFRAPNLGDMAKLGESKGATFEVPNRDLEPERVLTWDVGLDVESWLLNARLHGYLTRIGGIMSSVPTTWQGDDQVIIGDDVYDVRRKENVGEGIIRGVEWQGVILPRERVQLRAIATWTWGQNTTLDEPFDGIPPFIGTVGLQFTSDPGRWTIEPYLRFAGKQDRLSSDDKDDDRIPIGGTPGWITWNLRAQTPEWHGVRVTVALQNLTDLNYRVHASGINAPGRHLVLTMGWRPEVVRIQ